jgi:hypothetical protein
MRVCISNVSIEADGRIEVRFRSQFGEGTGKWCGPPPLLNSVYDVELEISETLKWNVNILSSDKTKPSISSADEVSILVGELSYYEDNTAASIRIGDDVIIVELDDVRNKRSGFVMIRTIAIILYDMNL